MEYVFKLNQSSTDLRVKALAQLLIEQGYQVRDIAAATTQPTIFFLEPRSQIKLQIFEQAPAGSLVFGYQKSVADISLPYVSLNDDPEFVQQNNALTAQAFQQIINQDYHGPKKMLLCGWGKLAQQLIKVLPDWEIAVLNFNPLKRAELKMKFGAQAYFAAAPTADFPVIVNTIPKELIRLKTWRKRTKQKVYELASPPYGFIWQGGEQAKFDYQILAGLPGKYYPQAAAQNVLAAIKRYLSSLPIAKPKLALCVTGSCCNYAKLLAELVNITQQFELIPVLSPHGDLPNRFMDCAKFKQQLSAITGHNVITTISGAETLSSLPDVAGSLILPCTGNTLAKLSHGITDTCVLMAVKALLRNGKPCIIGLATNDALSGNAQNIGVLLNRKNIYFVPFGQDNYATKPYSCVCDFQQVMPTVKAALQQQQIQPLLI